VCAACVGQTASSPDSGAAAGMAMDLGQNWDAHVIQARAIQGGDEEALRSTPRKGAACGLVGYCEGADFLGGGVCGAWPIWRREGATRPRWDDKGEIVQRDCCLVNCFQMKICQI
jgi:hypothetical protein